MTNKVKHWVWALPALLWVIGAASPASAEFYRYLDESGNVRYTDDFSKVPLDQREAVRQYRSTTTPAPQGESGESAAEEEAADETPAAGGQAGVTNEALNAEAGRLEAVRKELDAEYQEISSQQQALSQMKLKTTSKAKARQFLQEQDALKQRIDLYEQKRLQYEKEVKAYNDRVRAFNTKAAEGAVR